MPPLSIFTKTMRISIAFVKRELSPSGRVMIGNLVARPDLNGRMADVVEWVAARGRWKVRCDITGEIIAVKPENLMFLRAPARAVEEVPRCHSSHANMRDAVPVCHVLWRGRPPSVNRERVRTLLEIAGNVAFSNPDAGVSKDDFIAGGGVAAVVQIAFAGWPSDGLARSTHWADEVVTLGDVPYSARRVAISTLGEMAAEGVTLSDQTHGEAFAADPLLRREFGTAAAELIGAIGGSRTCRRTARRRRPAADDGRSAGQHREPDPDQLRAASRQRRAPVLGHR